MRVICQPLLSRKLAIHHVNLLNAWVLLAYGTFLVLHLIIHSVLHGNNINKLLEKTFLELGKVFFILWSGFLILNNWYPNKSNFLLHAVYFKALLSFSLHLLAFSLHDRVPMVFDGIVRPSFESFRYLGPLIFLLSVLNIEDKFFF